MKTNKNNHQLKNIKKDDIFKILFSIESKENMINQLSNVPIDEIINNDIGDIKLSKMEIYEITEKVNEIYGTKINVKDIKDISDLFVAINKKL